MNKLYHQLKTIVILIISLCFILIYNFNINYNNIYEDKKINIIINILFLLNIKINNIFNILLFNYENNGFKDIIKCIIIFNTIIFIYIFYLYYIIVIDKLELVRLSIIIKLYNIIYWLNFTFLYLYSILIILYIQ